MAISESVDFAVVGLQLVGKMQLNDGLVVLPAFAVDLAQRLADEGVVMFRLGDLRIQPGDVGVELVAALQRIGSTSRACSRFCTLLPQLMTAPQAASTASGIRFRPANARAWPS